MHKEAFLVGMVYREEGRECIEETRKTFTDISATYSGVKTVIKRMGIMLPEHPARAWFEKHDKNQAEIADTWLNPFARHYSVAGLRGLLERVGFSVEMNAAPVGDFPNGKLGFVARKKS